MLRIELFGDVRLSIEGRAPLRLGRQTALVLAYLAIHCEQFVDRARIASDLWPDVRDAEALTNLRRHLLLLQRAFREGGEVPLELARRTIRLPRTPALDVDLWRFDELAADPDGRDAAIALYRADLLEQYEAEWLVPVRERYRLRCIELLEGAFARAAQARDSAAALRAGRHLLTLDPLREDVVRQTIALRLAEGDRAAALETYRQLERRLREEFGAEPMPETVALYDEVRAGGRAPVRIAQIVPHGEVADAPRAATSFVGRARELAELRAKLRESRLISFVGVGGIGKSRLASALAADSADTFMDGTRFVELAGTQDDADPLPAIVRAFDLAQLSGEAMQRVLTEHLRHSHVLLVLDNCERHVAACRAILDWLLAACPNVSVLATSRLPLGARRESVYPVGPLSIPMSVGDGVSRSALDSDAVRLFLERARSAGAPPTAPGSSEEQAVVAICRHFDGVPLAIELAAARRRLLSAAQIRQRLSDASLVVDFSREGLPGHQRTVRAAIAWTFDALAGDERESLRALSIFRTPFVVEAVEAVTERSGTAALDLLTTLADHSLIFIKHDAGSVRYGMLEPVREFASAELEASDGAAEAYALGAAYFARLAAGLGMTGRPAEVRAAFDTFEADRQNVRAVLEGCARHRVAAGVAAELCASLVSFWQEHGHVDDGLAVHRALLDAFGEDAQAELLLGASRFTRLAADYERSAAYARSALERARREGDVPAEIDALHAAAIVDYTLAGLDAAARNQQHARELAARISDEVRLGRALANLGLIAIQTKRYDEAAHHLVDAVRRLSESGNDRLLAEATSALAYCERFRGRLTESRAFSLRSVSAAYDSGNASLLSTGLSNLAHLAVLEGDHRAAIPHLRESLELARSGAFLFTLAHDLEVAARLFCGLERYADAAVFLNGGRNLSKRLSLLRTEQEEAALAELERVILGNLSALEAAEAALVLRDASPARCVDEALARLAALGETRRRAAT